MVHTLNASYIQQPSYTVVSDHSTPTNSDDDISTCSSNKDDVFEEQCPPRNHKKRRMMISRITKYVVEFSFVKKLKMHKLSRRQRNNDDDKTLPLTNTIHNNMPLLNSLENEGISTIYTNMRSWQPPNASPALYESTSSSPLPILSTHQLNNCTSSMLTNIPLATSIKWSTSDSDALASTKRVFGFLRMHMLLIVSLATLVILGKACAILCTIVWLILLPLMSRFSNGRRWRLLKKEEETEKHGGNYNINERTTQDRHKAHGSLKEVWVPTTSYKW